MKLTQPPKAYWLIFLIFLALMLHGCATTAPEPEKQGPQVVLTKIEPREVDGKTEIAVEGTAPILQYTSFQLTEPLRLVIDIADADIGTLRDRLAVNQGAVTDITPSQKDNIARLEIGLTQAVESKVYQSDGRLVVEFVKPAEEAKTTSEIATAATETTPPSALPEQAPPPVAEKKETDQPESAAATVIKSVRASAGKEGVKVVITADGAMSPKAFMVSGNRLVVDIPGVKSRVRPSVIPVRKGGLDKVRVGQHAAPDQKVRVVLDMTKAMQ
jgi:AMIN domain